jgi:hemolysin activation/secretion protein
MSLLETPRLILATLATLAITINGLLITPDVMAQEFKDQVLPFERPGDKKLEVFDKPLFEEKSKPTLKLPSIKKEEEKESSIAGKLTIKINKIVFTGNTVFSNEILDTLIATYKNRTISALELEELRLIISNHYVKNGYINSGATLPNQDLEDGNLVLKITEGKLTEIKLKNSGALNQDYIIQRISSDNAKPLNLPQLQENLYLLQQNPRIKRINAALGPGLNRGESILDIMITEDRPYRLSLELNNHRAPSIGEGQAIIDLTHYNVSGAGDLLDISLSKTKGLDSGRFLYAWPLSPNGTLINFEYQLNDTEVTDDSFTQATDIDSDFNSIGLGIYYPLFKNTRSEYNVELKLDKRHSKTRLNNEETALSPGDDRGNNKVTALRLTQSWISQDQSSNIYALRHTLSLGLDALDSTVINDQPDSKFTTWLVQYQWAHRFQRYNMKSIVRTQWQFTMDPLLSMEKLAIGGAHSVRGYRENHIVRDGGMVFSLEGRIPLFTSSNHKQLVEAAAFYDYGRGKNKNDTDYDYIESVGLGLRWKYSDFLSAEFYWADPLTDITQTDNSLQDDGFHISLKAEL